MSESKRTLFKLEVFDDFTVNSFYALPNLGTIKGEPLNAKTISRLFEFLIEIFRISLSVSGRKQLRDSLDATFKKGEK